MSHRLVETGDRTRACGPPGSQSSGSNRWWFRNARAGKLRCMKRRIAVISTGGTIEKTYDELEGMLSNRVSNLDIMLASLQLSGVEVIRIPLMNKDSLEMSTEDHTLIAKTAWAMAEAHDGVVVVHGTDRLHVTGERTVAGDQPLTVPVVITGAMRPFELRTSDAIQNLTEALLAVQILPAGVYLAMHNQVLQFPGVRKDPTQGRFFRAPQPAA
ncbi:MAG: L-asparaginase [Myxococcota bacterium]